MTGAERSNLLPELPTMKEAGFPEIQALAWMAYMPPDIVARMNRELVATLNEPDTRQKLQAAYMDPVGNSPAGLAGRARALDARDQAQRRDGGLTAR